MYERRSFETHNLKNKKKNTFLTTRGFFGPRPKRAHVCARFKTLVTKYSFDSKKRDGDFWNENKYVTFLNPIGIAACPRRVVYSTMIYFIVYFYGCDISV